MAKAATTEVPAHPDLIEGWPSPEAQNDWFGNRRAEETLLAAFRDRALHHAWLIGGPRGIGKATLAYRMARFVLAHADPASEAVGMAENLAVSSHDPVFRKVAGRAHPNLLVMERPWDQRAKRFRTELTVSEVRRTVPFFGTTRGEDGWRVCIVDAADEMNVSAANALLKILEEPPPSSLFLIISHAPGRLLPTIRSRCRQLDMSPLPADAIARALRQHRPEVDEAEAGIASALADGSLRRAIQLIEGEGIALYRDFVGLTARLPQVDVSAAHAFADKVGARGRDDLWRAFQDLAGGWLNRRVRLSPEPDPKVTLSDAVQAASLESWAEVWDKLRRSAMDADIYNLDRKRTVLTIMSSLARATRM